MCGDDALTLIARTNIHDIARRLNNPEPSCIIGSVHPENRSNRQAKAADIVQFLCSCLPHRGIHPNSATLHHVLGQTLPSRVEGLYRLCYGIPAHHPTCSNCDIFILLDHHDLNALR